MIKINANNNKKLLAVADRVNKSKKIKAFLTSSNVVAVKRLQMNDHGITHVGIVANRALKILRNLAKANILPNIVIDYKMDYFDAEVVVFLASVLHDLGHVVNRKDHNKFSVVVAKSLIPEILEELYNEYDSIILESEILHAIITHHTDYEALTLEAEIVRISDALDMESGRARIPYKKGKINIHSVSATAIDKVDIKYTKKYPVVIEITMTNSAGIYQVDNLLKQKIESSNIQKHIKLVAFVKGKSEKKLIKRYSM